MKSEDSGGSLPHFERSGRLRSSRPYSIREAIFYSSFGIQLVVSVMSRTAIRLFIEFIHLVFTTSHHRMVVPYLRLLRPRVLSNSFDSRLKLVVTSRVVVP